MLWSILVMSADGTAKDTVSVNDPIARLTDFSVDAAGSCLEASFAALPSRVDISARDIITLQRVTTDGEGKTFYDPVWRGVVTLAGNPRSSDLQEYRAVGLKQRFYERVLDDALVEGADVASMVDAVMSGMALPVGVAYFSANVPVTAFELGDRYPMLESVGSFLDFMAESVGSFIVPTGESYTYDGVTYSAGETVPAVMWGVSGNGRFFFRRPQASSVAVSEGDVTTRVTWNAVSAEEYTNVVRLLYMSDWVDGSNVGLDRTGFFNVPQATMVWPLVAPPLQRSFGVSDTAKDTWAELLVALPNPLDYMTTIPVEVKASTGFTNASSAVDGFDGTYAHFSGGGANNIRLRPQSAATVNGCLWRVRFASPSPDGATWSFWAEAHSTAAGTGNYATVQYEVSGEDAPARSATTDVYMYIAEPVGWASGPLTYTELFITSSGSTNEDTNERLYEVECYVPDVDASEHGSEALADGYLRAVPPEVATVEVQGLGLGAVTNSLDLTPLDGAVLTGLRVERTSYRITVADGAVTTYHVGQAFEPDLEAQRIVLERLARKANNNEPVSRPKKAS